MSFFSIASKATSYPPLHNFLEYEAAVRSIKNYEVEINSKSGISAAQYREYAELVLRAGDFEAENNLNTTPKTDHNG